MIYNHISELIGNTPLLKIDPSVHGLKNIDLYAKLEFYNPFGSVKDRIAWGMIQNDLGEIRKDKKTIIESSSGNTAKALAVLASVSGVPFKTITNRIKVPEVKKILKLLGTDLEELPGLSECPDPNDPNDVLVYVEKTIQKDPKHFYHASQYTNEKNVETHYKTTGKELIDDLGAVDYLFAGLGTTGSSRGAATYIKEKDSQAKAIGVVAAQGDYIPGIRNTDELLEVGLFHKDFYDEVEVVDSLAAVDSMLMLIKKSGILCGPTSGASFAGTLQYLKVRDLELKGRKTAVFIVCDRVEWYISYIEKRRPELFREADTKQTVRNQLAVVIQDAPSISVVDVKEWIEKERPIIVDIRGNMAYRVGHIPDAINILDQDFEQMVESGMPFPSNRALLLTCPIGEQSKKFSSYLTKKGYLVKSLEGGIVAWRDAGLPLEKVSM